MWVEVEGVGGGGSEGEGRSLGGCGGGEGEAGVSMRVRGDEGLMVRVWVVEGVWVSVWVRVGGLDYKFIPHVATTPAGYFLFFLITGKGGFGVPLRATRWLAGNNR